MIRVCFVIVTLFYSAVSDSSKDSGHVSGYLADCPGTEIPQPIPAINLNFLAITIQSHGKIFYRSTYNYYNIKNLIIPPNVDFKKPTVMYVGGYMDHPMLPFALTVGAEYRKLGYNVMLLNTHKFTAVSYPIAANNMRTIGKHVAEMLSALTKYGFDPKKLQLLGLSLGAQTASFIAKNYRLLTGMNISRITGLDPAGPCFRNLGPSDRLDKSDADFVDVVETNIDGFGMAAPIGHVNFYVNGGEFQPGDFFWVPCTVLCSHIRSFTIWIAALNNPNSFIAMKCDSVNEARHRECYDKNPMETNVLGLNADRNAPGIFYLATLNDYPYYMGLKGLKKENEFFDSKLNMSKTSTKGWLL